MMEWIRALSEVAGLVGKDVQEELGSYIELKHFRAEERRRKERKESEEREKEEEMAKQQQQQKTEGSITTPAWFSASTRSINL